MEKNLEAAVELAGSIREPALKELLEFTRGSVGYGEPVTQALAGRYRLSCKRAARLPKPPRDPFTASARLSSKAASSRLVQMSWSDYSKAVYRARHHDVHGSLELLRIAQTWLASVASFQNLEPAQRKALAGVVGKKDKTRPDWYNEEKAEGGEAELWEGSAAMLDAILYRP